MIDKDGVLKYGDTFGNKNDAEEDANVPPINQEQDLPF